MKLTIPKEKRIFWGICVILAGMLFLAVVPLVWVGIYAHPSADDYTYGYYARCAWISSHSILEVLKAAIDQVRLSYYSWQGTFSSIFLMAMGPAVFEGSFSYAVTPIVMITVIIISVFTISNVILVQILKAEKVYWISISSVTVFLMLETIESPVNGLYWFNGSVHYVFMHSMMLIMAAMAMFVMGIELKIITASKRFIALIIASVTAIMCAGSNYSTALLGFVLIVVITVIGSLLNRRISANVIVMGVYLASFIISMMAPGNNVRGDNFAGMGPVEAVLESYKVVYILGRQWNWAQTILVIVCIVPICAGAVKNITYKFRFPLLFSFISLSLVASMNAPLLYAMGGAGVLRQVNILKMFFQLMLIFNILYWVGWIGSKKRKVVETVGRPSVWLACFLVFLIGTLAHFKTDARVLNDYSSYAAYVSLRTGEAETYDCEYRARLDIINNSDEYVEIEEFAVKPYLLFFDDITEDPYDWRNSAYSSWWGKNSIVLRRLQ